MSHSPLNRESYMVMLTEGYGAEYAATLNTYMPMWIAPIMQYRHAGSAFCK